ncbi:unnamed protein product (macronuclear) [Paramecium tetraurelia]|uniref:Uncharacterized protein n=1 Tax=Paramecium tetraurelia TaxID=5888 RepID=A0D300_PARTE|nr:uncharacterized protein GSPATT00012902001 [Paramecium tetraurelia]CAK77417.1 unnamed protein product [Paramecium tetraurelia]|eukprot:XP_001444814.1 hypothetical protein (macronuclear) [Paramecium tetraurelia strain d4-2]
MSDDDVEIIHSSQYGDSLPQQVLGSQIIPNLQSDNQKLQQSNKSLETEVKQYKHLLEQTLETLRQSERDQNTLKLQLSQKDFQLQAIQANVEERQKSAKIESHQKLKDSNSNRDSFGNKQTNVSSIGGFLSSTQSPRCQCDGFHTRGQTLIETMKKIQFSLKQNEQSAYSQDLFKILQELEENLKQFLTLHEQFAIEIHRNRIDQTEQQSQNKQQSTHSMSDQFHSLEDQNTNQNPNQQILNNDELDTSQFESEQHIKQQFECFEMSLAKLNEEEKQYWKQKLLQLINTL